MADQRNALLFFLAALNKEVSAECSLPPPSLLSLSFSLVLSPSVLLIYVLYLAKEGCIRIRMDEQRGSAQKHSIKSHPESETVLLENIE